MGEPPDGEITALLVRWQHGDANALEALIPLVLESGRDVTFSWVKGHSGDVMNDFVDQLATAAADSQQGRHS